MAKKAALTESDIKKAQPKDSQYKLYDTDGLFLVVLPSGTKSFRLKYFFEKKDCYMVLGLWPEISLKEARALRDDVRQKVRQGISPVEKKLKTDASLSFESVALQWYQKQLPSWTAIYAETVMKNFKKDIFPGIGSEPVTTLTASQVLKCLQRAESRGAIETAHRQLSVVRDILNFAIASRLIAINPALGIKDALTKRKPVKHMAAPTEPDALRRILLLIDGHQGTPIVKTALQILPHLFCRPGELRLMKWSEIDFDAAQWKFVLAKTKQLHIAPLSHQVISLLKSIKEVTGDREYVFPGWKNASKGPMSNNAMVYALRDLGLEKEEICPHGFRAVARTFLDEQLEFEPHIIEAQLGHTVKDALGRAYNRTSHIKRRTEMMQQWSDYLDALKKKN